MWETNILNGVWHVTNAQLGLDYLEGDDFVYSNGSYTVKGDYLPLSDENLRKVKFTAKDFNERTVAYLNIVDSKKGDTGPQGPQGPPGKDGTNGKNGTLGTPNYINKSTGEGTTNGEWYYEITETEYNHLKDSFFMSIRVSLVGKSDNSYSAFLTSKQMFIDTINAIQLHENNSINLGTLSEPHSIFVKIVPDTTPNGTKYRIHCTDYYLSYDSSSTNDKNIRWVKSSVLGALLSLEIIYW